MAFSANQPLDGLVRKDIRNVRVARKEEDKEFVKIYSWMYKIHFYLIQRQNKTNGNI